MLSKVEINAPFSSEVSHLRSPKLICTWETDGSLTNIPDELSTTMKDLRVCGRVCAVTWTFPIPTSFHFNNPNPTLPYVTSLH